MLWLQVIVSVFLVSVISLVGIVTVSVRQERLKRVVFVLIGLAAGGLFGDAFIHLLPESYEELNSGTKAAVYILAGLFGFFILEKFLRWRHEHSPPAKSEVHPMGWMNLVADGLHNLIDGMLIGASYMVSFPVGVTTTLAVILHEIPQEIGDFGVLIQAGMSPRKALLLNYFSATLAIAGAVIALLVGARVRGFTSAMLPITAGGFIYIAGADLLPELHRENDPAKSVLQLLAMTAGVGVMFLLTMLE
ncbi:MAG: ZIP family metal transporter [Acidobacteria bacterium]|nr:ZIP family metal transporter [Acidobacteriota bacterium]